MTQKTGNNVGAPPSEKTILKYIDVDETPIIPPYPIGLTLQVAKKAWENVWLSGRVLPVESILVEDYAFAVQELAKKRKEYNATEHWVVMGNNGAIQPHPVVAQLEKARATFVRYHNILILTPEARVRASIDMDNNVDKKLEDYVKRSSTRAKEREKL